MNLDALTPIVLVLVVVGIAVLILQQYFKKKPEAVEDLRPQNAALQSNIESLTASIKELKEEIEVLREKERKLSTENSRLEERNNNLLSQIQNEKEEIQKLQEHFRKEFENLAHQILQKSSDRLSDLNQDKLKNILNPLKQDIDTFKQKIESNHNQNISWNSQLKTIIQDLSQKNENLSKDAQNLVQALKGESKQQGGWGELVLQRTLEMAGLIEGQEYKMEVATSNAEGKQIRPDAVVYLPDNKHIIIDSKVSLSAYVKYSESVDSEERKTHLKNHIISIRKHIQSLSEKAYPSGQGFDAPDIVLMFVPVEHGFELAMHEDQQLYEFAYERNIVIVSAATLLATLKTVASIWKQEKQNKNVQLIAEEASKMYDKFVSFTETLHKIGNAIDRASEEYDKGINQLKTGRGNLVGRALKIKKLGAKGAKELPSVLLEDEEDESIE